MSGVSLLLVADVGFRFLFLTSQARQFFGSFTRPPGACLVNKTLSLDVLLLSIFSNYLRWKNPRPSSPLVW